MNPVDPVDVVFTWVDGNDPAHRARLAGHQPTSRHVADVAGPTRFASIGEIDRAVLSVLRFAPFVRRIHVVTDRQVPPIVHAARAWPPALRDRIVLVDHAEIFRGFEHHLPTFSARSIESLIHRIPGLAEHHVYLNDDFMLVKPVLLRDWFDAGRPVLRGRWRTPMDREWGQRLRAWLRARLGWQKEKRPLHQRSQALAASLVGFGHRYFSTQHVPHPMRRSTLADFFARQPHLLARNLQSRFRDLSQFNTPSLANHLELLAGHARTTAQLRRFYAEPASLTLREFAEQLRDAEQDPAVLSICLQSLDSAPADTQALALAWLDRLIGPVRPEAGLAHTAGAADQSLTKS